MPLLKHVLLNILIKKGTVLSINPDTDAEGIPQINDIHWLVTPEGLKWPLTTQGCDWAVYTIQGNKWLNSNKGKNHLSNWAKDLLNHPDRPQKHYGRFISVIYGPK